MVLIANYSSLNYPRAMQASHLLVMVAPNNGAAKISDPRELASNQQGKYWHRAKTWLTYLAFIRVRLSTRLTQHVEDWASRLPFSSQRASCRLMWLTFCWSKNTPLRFKSSFFSSSAALWQSVELNVWLLITFIIKINRNHHGKMHHSNIASLITHATQKSNLKSKAICIWSFKSLFQRALATIFISLLLAFILSPKGF